MRIGLFGGTFNPIHHGHLRAVLEVKEGFPLDECYLIPVAIPPHKTTDDMASGDNRLEMIREAVSGHSGLSACDVELNRSGPSYTIDTVKYLKKSLPEDTLLFLILGIDAFLEIDTWNSYRELLQTIPFIVIARPDNESCNETEHWQTLKEFLKTKISADYCYSESKACFSHHQLQPVFNYSVTMLDISSSKIREMIRNGCSVRFLVPDKVEALINSKGLYL
jgi:nicotinate-nucleotide adenylyltransferase